MKVLIVDDHAIVRAGLARLLAADQQIEIREAAAGREALGIYKEYRPHLVILDLNLPGIGGLEVIGRLKIEDPDARILVLSMHHDALHVSRAFQAGAAGYLSKNAPPDEILEAINRVGNGQNYIEREIAQELALQNVRTPSPLLKDLSRRELEIMRLLSEGYGLPQIADTIGISYKTVANSCGQIKAKLGVARTADLIRLAIVHGLGAEGGGLAKSVPGDRQA
jgi:two-component system, NarL family, invasion response regulator UvrY